MFITNPYHRWKIQAYLFACTLYSVSCQHYVLCVNFLLDFEMLVVLSCVLFWRTEETHFVQGRGMIFNLPVQTLYPPSKKYVPESWWKDCGGDTGHKNFPFPPRTKRISSAIGKSSWETTPKSKLISFLIEILLQFGSFGSP